MTTTEELSKDHIELSPPGVTDPLQVFELIEKLGEGSYGSVWRAKHIKTGKEYAIKRVGIDNDLNELMVEINFMKSCISPYIVRYYGSYVKDNELWIVMEYCRVGSVADLMNSILSPIVDETQISLICYYVLKGLEFLHGKHKIHRDIKCGNVLLNSNGEGKLADFGVSGQLADTMAKRHTVIGTPFWMAPEVIQEIGYNEKADIWSVGITAIEIAEGNPPYSDVHPMRVIFMIPSRPPPTLTNPAKWSDEFNDFIARCLTKDPKKRPTAKELLTHPFIEVGARCATSGGPSPLAPLIKKQDDVIKEIGREKAFGLDEDFEDDEEGNDGGDRTSDFGDTTKFLGKSSSSSSSDDDDDSEFGDDSGTMVIKKESNVKKKVIVDSDSDSDDDSNCSVSFKDSDDEGDNKKAADEGTDFLEYIRKEQESKKKEQKQQQESEKVNRPYKDWTVEQIQAEIEKYNEIRKKKIAEINLRHKQSMSEIAKELRDHKNN